jgi:Cu/Ag efflux protein CusF
VEVEHDDIEGVMPAMKMIWSVKDKAMLKPIRVGDKVNFKVQDNNGSELITELTKTTTGR